MPVPTGLEMQGRHRKSVKVPPSSRSREDGEAKRSGRESGRERASSDERKNAGERRSGDAKASDRSERNERRANQERDKDAKRETRRSAEPSEGKQRTADKDKDSKRARIKERVDRGSLRRAQKDVDINFRVGVNLPRTVSLYALPNYIIDVYPSYRPYRYYYDGDVIVVVDPDTYRVVDVIQL